MVRVVQVSLLVGDVFGHGSMVIPPPRNNVIEEYPTPDNGWGNGCMGNSCLWWSAGCFIGCDACSATHAGASVPAYPDQNDCFNPMDPTLDDSFRTFNVYGDSTYGDWNMNNPWRAPGFAPNMGPCGSAGAYGDYPDDANGGKPVDGYPVLTPGVDLPPTDNSRWKIGEVAEVGWQIRANHGGGYQYRLCPKWRSPDEECFQGWVLPFSDQATTIRYFDGSRGDFDIDVMDVCDGTWPEGSCWRRNPIPNCIYSEKGEAEPEEPGLPPGTAYTPHANCPYGCSFEPWWDEGCGTNSWTLDSLPFALVDRVVLPMTPGEYILSWRWDCEQTAQVWNNCADIVLNTDDFNPYAIAIKDVSSKCLHLPWGDTSNGNFVKIWDCNPYADEQMWVFDADSWTIRYSDDPSKCLDIPGSDTTAGTYLWIWDCNDNPSQKWGYNWDESTIYSTLDYSQCISLANDDNINGNGIWIWDCDSSNYAQQWLVPSAEYVGFSDWACIDVRDGDLSKGTPLQIWECNGFANQGFVWASEPNGGSTIRYAADMSKCLDLAGGDDTNGNYFQLWDCNGGWQQSFGFDEYMGTLYLTTSGDASKCVDAGDGSEGNTLIIWDCNQMDSQVFGRGSFMGLAEKLGRDLKGQMKSRRDHLKYVRNSSSQKML